MSCSCGIAVTHAAMTVHHGHEFAEEREAILFHAVFVPADDDEKQEFPNGNDAEADEHDWKNRRHCALRGAQILLNF